MADSVRGQEFNDVMDAARRAAALPPGSTDVIKVKVDGETIPIRRPFPSPEDWRDVWVYHLMVDRFCSSPDTSPNAPLPAPKAPPPASSTDWAYPRCRVFQGGTLKGVQSQLEYVEKLGARAIWLSPFLKTTPDKEAYHGYGIQDFLRVDPRFGTAADLRALVDEAHKRHLWVLFDVVLNHAGNVFSYVLESAQVKPSAPWRAQVYPVQWRDGGTEGAPRPDWPEVEGVTNPPSDGVVWPKELQRNALFRRQGKGGERGGDFEELKEFITDPNQTDVLNVLIDVYRYLLAVYDPDGMRIDTLKYVEPEFGRVFCNAMREFALSLGKRNLYSVGEIWDDEGKISSFVGRDAGAVGEPIGVDAAIDFPVMGKLPQVVKGFLPPAALAAVYQDRKNAEKGRLSTHGDAGLYFLKSVDNHDQVQRIHCGKPQFLPQVSMAVATLFSLQGISCIYYGTEQGFSGDGSKYPDTDIGRHNAVREPLWPSKFDQQHSCYLAIQAVSRVYASQPALRYGRQYFRQVSENGQEYAISERVRGVLAVARICAGDEVLLVANTDPEGKFAGWVVVDRALTPPGRKFDVLYSNQTNPTAPEKAVLQTGVTVHEPDGTIGYGPVVAVQVRLAPMEVQILGRRPAAGT